MRKTIEYYINQYRYIIQVLADEYDDEDNEVYKMNLLIRSDVWNKALSDMELLLKLCDVYDL